MRNTFLLLAALIMLTSCAGMGRTGKSMAEDLGSPEKVELLRERANGFWSAFVNKDYEMVYNIFDPFFQAKTDKKSYLNQDWKINYHEFEVKDIRVQGNLGYVKVNIVYSVPQAAGKPVELSQQATRTEFEETWLYIYDNWYKQYKLDSINESFAYY